MSMRTTQEIVKSIDNRLRELNDEIKTLNAARVALDGRENRSSRRPPTTATGRHRSPRANARNKPSAQSKRQASADVVSEPRLDRAGALAQHLGPSARRTSRAIPAGPPRGASVRQRRTDHVRARRASRRESRPSAQATPGLGERRPDPPNRPTPRDTMARDHRRGPHPRADRRTGSHAQPPCVTPPRATTTNLD